MTLELPSTQESAAIVPSSPVTYAASCPIPCDPATQFYLPEKSLALALLQQQNEALQLQLSQLRENVKQVDAEIHAMESALQKKLQMYHMQGFDDGIILHLNMNPGAIKTQSQMQKAAADLAYRPDAREVRGEEEELDGLGLFD